MPNEYVSGVYCRECGERSTFVRVAHALKCNNCGWLPTGPEGVYDA